MTRSALLGLALSCAAGTAACGDDGDERGGGRPAEPTRIVVEVRPRGPEGPLRRRTIDCSQNPRTAECRRLADVPRSAFEPVPRNAVCTQIYGGPATARVRGTLRGDAVDARFTRRNGCEIARWDRLEWLLSPS